MIIKRSIDIEEEVRKALEDHLKAYCRPLPSKYTLPNVLISSTGGFESQAIDTFTVALDARSKSDSEASETLRTAVGIIKEVAAEQTTAIRYVVENTKPAAYTDPVRPDLKVYRTTLLITAHQEKVEV